MNATTYRVWMQLVSARDWMCLSEVAYNVNLTNKQTLAHIKMLPSPPVEKAHIEGCRGMCFRLAPTDDFDHMDRRVRAMCYGVTKELMSKVRSCRDSGLESVDDIVMQTGLRPKVVATALLILNGEEEPQIGGP